MTDGPGAARALRLAVAASAASAESAEFVVEAERLGADAAWSAELWGYDALTQLGYLAARTSRIGLGTSIVQLGARTPAMLAMSAMSLQQLSGGRFRLGIGASGPQVMEGWHGVRFRRPVQATRETIEIIRMVSRGDRLEYHGQVYDLPLPGSQGRALRTMAAPVHVPVYIAASARPTWRSPASWPTAGSATPSSPSPPRCSSDRCAPGRSEPAGRWPTWTCRSR
jgi:alkanesulfonate monooxygenase SsuD/methylene tetrahydromethanopterin reductase-like flavin-dependent oxidoreductase (luciferase family)